MGLRHRKLEKNRYLPPFQFPVFTIAVERIWRLKRHDFVLFESTVIRWILEVGDGVLSHVSNTMHPY